MNRNRISLSVLLAAASALACVTGCSGPSYDHTTVTNVSQGDLAGIVSLQTISMPVGAAVRATITPYNDDNKGMGGDVISDGPTVLEVAPGIDSGEYIFMGRAVGTTTVRFLADGQVIAVARAEVTAQGAP